MISDRGCSGKYLAMDLLHFYGYPWCFFCHELDSWCPQWVNILISINSSLPDGHILDLIQLTAVIMG